MWVSFLSHASCVLFRQGLWSKPKLINPAKCMLPCQASCMTLRVQTQVLTCMAGIHWASSAPPLLKNKKIRNKCFHIIVKMFFFFLLVFDLFVFKLILEMIYTIQWRVIRVALNVLKSLTRRLSYLLKCYSLFLKHFYVSPFGAVVFYLLGRSSIVRFLLLWLTPGPKPTLERKNWFAYSLKSFSEGC